MTTATSQLHDELLSLYGRSLADSAVLDFLARHGFKVPKTLHKSARAAGSDWLSHKKANAELLLATQPYNPLFPPLPAQRKGMLVPRLACAVFSGQHIALPAGLDWNASAEEAGQRLGAPWWPRNDLGHRVWRVPHLGAAHVNTQLTVNLTRAGVRTPWVGINVNVPAMELGLHGGPLFKLEEARHLYPRLMLMAWQLHQLGHAPTSTSANDSLAILTQTMHDLGRSYLLREDLAELHHTFAQRLAEFEASGWSDSAPSPA